MAPVTVLPICPCLYRGFLRVVSYLYSLAHPELTASIQLLFFGHYHMVTTGNPHNI